MYSVQVFPLLTASSPDRHPDLRPASIVHRIMAWFPFWTIPIFYTTRSPAWLCPGLHIPLVSLTASTLVSTVSRTTSPQKGKHPPGLSYTYLGTSWCGGTYRGTKYVLCSIPTHTAQGSSLDRPTHRVTDMGHGLPNTEYGYNHVGKKREKIKPKVAEKKKRK
ncbi:hypothetical protein LX36DRAFT_312821 [Colletotrichum falcatum]|nr:hypothetical protein LX36DRAFT_312821 [Colletotrichum falcatum]